MGAKKPLKRRFGLLFELLEFVKIGNKWWLLPLIIMLLLVGVLIIVTGSSALSPFIYALF